VDQLETVFVLVIFGALLPEDDEQYSSMLDCISIYSIARDRAELSNKEFYNRLTDAQNIISAERPSGYFPQQEINQRKEFHLERAAGNDTGYIILELVRCGFAN
jgi:hypothetical protein